MKFVPIIGLEIHVQPKTKSKMFCSCATDIFEAEPNTRVCPVCYGLPGALPVPNKRAVEQTIKLGLGLSGKIAQHSQFDRKNYFYPDLPKGYQISQYEHPLVEEGYLSVTDSVSGNEKDIRITRVHLEEDTARLSHKKDPVTGEEYSLIDFNRSGMPLIEIVTEPDIRSASEMREFLKKLRQILRYLDISDADMEKGTMRIEPNVSAAYVDDAISTKAIYEHLPNYKVELKNINSFKFAEKATEFEIARQMKAIEAGETLYQETRGWDENRQVTFSQRRKENAHDYRYFPEPDIPPMVIDEDWVEKINSEAPQGPDVFAKFFKDHGLGDDDIDTLLEKRSLCEFVSELISQSPDGRGKEFAVKVINNPLLIEGDVSPQQIIDQILEEEKSLVGDQNELKTIAQEVLSENPDEVVRYKEGKVELDQFFMGKMMQKTRGKAEPATAVKILKDILSD